MKILDVLVFISVIAIMWMLMCTGVELPMSLRFGLLFAGSLAVVDFCDR